MQLPTLQCSFRTRPRTEATTEVADCLLIQQLTGVEEPALFRVSRTACEYCRKSHEPSVHQLNSVVGSLLFALTTEVLHRGGVAGCDRDKADRIRRWSEEFIDNDPADVDDPPVPERIKHPCHYLGEPIDDRDPPPGPERVPPVRFRCQHPARTETTQEDCIRCRDWSDRPRPDATPVANWLPVPTIRVGAPVRHWAVGVTTSPRRRPTLEWTLDSLVRAGWDQARLFVDGPIDLPSRYAHFPVTQRSPKSGAWPNFYLGLAELLMREPDADAYLMVQDDVQFYDRVNLREYVESILWPSDPAPPISLYSCQLDVAPQPGWTPHNAPWFRGALALIFHPESVRRFLIDPGVFGHRWNVGKDGLAHVDTVVGAWGHHAGTPVLFPTPSLCRHIGHTSTLWPAGKVDNDRKEGAFGDEVEGETRLQGPSSPAAGSPVRPTANGQGKPRPERKPPVTISPQPQGSRPLALRNPPARPLSLDAFPEDDFPCPEPSRAAYQRTVERGLARMRSLSVTLYGIGRDVAETFPAFVARVERLGAMFGTYHALFYENDSTDESPRLLNEWANANPAVQVISEQRGDVRFGSVRAASRGSALAAYRNRCRDRILADFATDDHVIVVDMDLKGGWSYDGIAHTFGLDDWDFVGSSGLIPETLTPTPEGSEARRWIQYDTWAYRIPGDEEPIPNARAKHLPLRRGDPLQRVWSCFGGLGIYRMECLKVASYSGGDCEHAVFHHNLRLRGLDRLFLNPNQIVVYHFP